MIKTELKNGGVIEKAEDVISVEIEKTVNLTEFYGKMVKPMSEMAVSSDPYLKAINSYVMFLISNGKNVAVSQIAEQANYLLASDDVPSFDQTLYYEIVGE